MDRLFQMLSQQKKKDMMRSISYLLREIYQLATFPFVLNDNKDEKDTWCIAKYKESIGKD